jgi:hypothetical protein
MDRNESWPKAEKVGNVFTTSLKILMSFEQGSDINYRHMKRGKTWHQLST